MCVRICITDDETCETEISMYLYNNNVLGFTKNGLQLTTRWNLDDLAEWLRSFLDNMCEDPYPVETCGTYAAEKDISARDFDSEDDDEFEAYYPVTMTDNTKSFFSRYPKKILSHPK